MSKKTEIEAGLAGVRAAVGAINRVQEIQSDELDELRNELVAMREWVDGALAAFHLCDHSQFEDSQAPKEDRQRLWTAEPKATYYGGARHCNKPAEDPPEMTSDERITNLEKSLDNLIERFNKREVQREYMSHGIYHDSTPKLVKNRASDWSRQEQARMEPKEPEFDIVRLDDDPHSYLQLRVNDARDLFIEDIVYGNYGYSQRSALRMMRFAYEEGQKAGKG